MTSVVEFSIALTYFTKVNPDLKLTQIPVDEKYKHYISNVKFQKQRLNNFMPKLLSRRRGLLLTHEWYAISAEFYH